MTAPWRRAFEPLPREHGFEPLAVEGRLPATLRGTLYRVGPGSFAVGAEPFGHWFDGDGVVTAVRLGDGVAEGACRFVDSRERAVEQRLGRRAFRGFGTPAARPAAARVKHPVNVGAMRWSGGVYALGEGARPHALYESTLQTRGESDLGGVLQSAFAAHPHRVEARRAAYNFGVRYGRTFALDLIELPDARSARVLCTVPMRSPRYLHDFAVTERRAVFLLAPLEADVQALLHGQGSVASAYQWRADHATEVLTVDLDPPHRASWTEVDPFFAWHLAGAVELGGGALAVEVIRYGDFASSNDWYAALPYREPPASPRGELVRLVGSKAERLADASCELPVASGQEIFAVAHSAAANGAAPHDALVAIDRRGRWERWFSLGPDRFPSGEPCLVGDHHLLTLAFDGRGYRTGLLVLDRRDPGAGVIAAAWFDHHIPPAFHGVWAPGE